MAVTEFKSFSERTDQIRLRVNPGWKKVIFDQAKRRGISASEMIIWSVNAVVMNNPKLMDELASRTREREDVEDLVLDYQVELDEYPIKVY